MYTSEKGTLCLISLLKAHGVKKVIASPGTTNHVFVASIQSDPWFELYSSVDERSAAYIACGMSAESGEPVVITCTGATASRNYLSGLTEAYYRKLPVIAVTYNGGIHQKNHLVAHQIDRDSIQKDVARCSVNIPIIKDATDHWLCNVEINKALLAVTFNGGGPAHINISTGYSSDFHLTKLPEERVIKRIYADDKFPSLPDGKTVIFVGSHANFTPEETQAIDSFCEATDSVVLCDHTSGYYGKFRVQASLIGAQKGNDSFKNIRLLIHLGEVSGDYYSMTFPEEVWRVSEDGEIKDTFHTLTNLFHMNCTQFFSTLNNAVKQEKNMTLLAACKKELEEIMDAIPELPFGNIWIAKQTAGLIPPKSVVHLGILNSLRSWNFFQFANGVESYCNVGGFGIDGILSTIIGSAIVSPDKKHYAILGDLAFFYDLNSLGNRHVPANLRILLINNGRGTEFTNYNHPCYKFGEKAVPFMAAGGHFGCKSRDLVKNYSENLGFKYLTADSKKSYLDTIESFLNSDEKQPVVFEVFTNPDDESNALEAILNIKQNQPGKNFSLKSAIKESARQILGDKGRRILDIIKE